MVSISDIYKKFKTRKGKIIRIPDANRELILHIKKRDQHYRGHYLDDYQYKDLLKIKAYIDKKMEGLPHGYIIDSNGRAEE